MKNSWKTNFTNIRTLTLVDKSRSCAGFCRVTRVCTNINILFIYSFIRTNWHNTLHCSVLFIFITIL